MGPLKIDAPETHSALWVVDGQQRIIALAGGLAHPQPIPVTPDDPWVIYFDAATQRFVPPPKNGDIPSAWVPVAQLLDASGLSEWVHNWRHSDDAALRSIVFQAGTRIRQYRIPLYIVDTNDEQLLRDIFFRINNYGKSLEWQEVHDALFGTGSDHPSTLAGLANELQKLEMGRPEEEQLLRCLIAWSGLDVTRTLTELYRRDPEVLKGAVHNALPAMRGVLSFLREPAEIPHIRLLPRSLPLVILTRFFALHPDPNPRTAELLVRFIWRLLLSVESFDERTLLRHGVAAIREDGEEPSVQRLLALVPKKSHSEYVLPERSDGRAADSRLAFLGMASLSPLQLDGRTRIDIASLIETRGTGAFRRVFSPGDPLTQSPANRILLPGTSEARRDLAETAEQGSDTSAILGSHAITKEASEALLAGDSRSFLAARKATVETAVHNLAERLAGWSRNDRPSIEYLLEKAKP
jgi:hypothetical protein